MKNNIEFKKHSGFTLSETLIALTLMGILGAILIPVIMQKKPNNSRIMLRKEYSVLEKVVSKLINDEYLYPASQTTNVSGTIYERGFNYTDDPSGLSSGFNKFCYYLADNMNIMGEQTCPNTSSTTTLTQFATTSDGADWFIYPNTYQFTIGDATKAYGLRLIVDVNGGSKPPNCIADSSITISILPTAPFNYQTNSGNTTKCPIPDTFSFGIRYDGKIRAANVSIDENSKTTTDTVAESYLAAPLKNLD